MITRPKGTYDLYGEKADIYNYAIDTFKGICELNCYSYIKTPTFENSNLFHRGVGESTDIVTKETYDFKDRGDRDMTLRPEGTAGIVRALIENKLYANQNGYLKYYYYGSMFRYERPQAGRYREFTQLGVEVYGNMNPYIDAEVINMGVKYFNILGIENIKVKINNLGSSEERLEYRNALINYMQEHKEELCEDCINRLEKNPLRILDCKIDSTKEFFKNAPKIENYLNEDSKKYFNTLLETLDALEIEYEIDNNLVRGLDYYDYAVFEFITGDERLSGASTICGGGRYNNMVATLDGPSINGVGFAIGFERLSEILSSLELIKTKDSIDAYVVPVTNNELSDAFIIATMLRDAGFITEIDYRDTNVKNKLSTAGKSNVNYIIIVGEEEIKKYSVKLKDARTKEEQLISINDLADYLYMNN